ncbi:hypothetical protein ACFMQL_20695 [Nonomuraea fastidiosa]|uniref:hypothetical protein n=1 Tax=Nonomuraea fastidiosa TaxID=46173 RepID=UPI00366B0553
MPLGWRIVADLKKAGTNLTRDTLRDAVRASGTPISTQRATVLLQRLRAEAPAEPPLKTTPEDRPQGTNGGPSSAPAGDEPGTNGRPSSEDDKDEEGTKARPVLTDNTTTDEPHGDTP